MHVGLRIFASWALQGNISKAISCFSYEVGGKSRCLSISSPRNTSWWVKLKCLWLLEGSLWKCAGCKASSQVPLLVSCASANTSLKFPVNLTDSKLTLFLRKNSSPTLQMENVKQWLPLKTKPTPFDKTQMWFLFRNHHQLSSTDGRRSSFFPSSAIFN